MADTLIEQTMIVTPAMRAKIEELVELVIGALPGYKIADVKFSVTLTLNPEAAGEAPSTCRVLLRQPCRSRGPEAPRMNLARPAL